MSVLVADELSDILQTKVSIGRINTGLLNRVIIDDVLIDDRSGKEMARISRLSAKYDILPLFKGRILIGSVQLFGFDIKLNKSTPYSESNFQFVLDAFASKDSVQRDMNLDLRINSLLIRRGKFSYDVLSEQETPGKFNPNHIKLYNIVGNISLKAFRNDSVNAQIKRLSVDEQSGFELRKLNMKVYGNQNKMSIEDFTIDLPNTSLKMDTIKMKYDSFEAFKKFVTDVNFNFRMPSSHITLQDFSSFIPAFSNFKDKIWLELDAYGSIDQLTCSKVNAYVDRHLFVRGNASFQDLSNPKEAFVFGKLSNLSATDKGLEFLARNFNGANEGTPPILSRLGNVTFNGEISGYFTDLVMYGYFGTGLGLLKGDVKLSSNKDNGEFSYSGGVKTEKFDVGGLLANTKLGNVTFNLDVNSTFYSNANKYPHLILKGLINKIEYSDYEYKGITLDGEYKNGGFDGLIEINDENGSAYLNGNFNIVSEVPTFNFDAGFNQIRPHKLNLTNKYEDAEFSLALRANFSGGNIEDMVGTIDIDSLLFTAPEKFFFMDNLRVRALHIANKKVLTVNSPFLTANIQGNYSYQDLPASFINMVKQYIPTVFNDWNKKIKVPNNNFTFDVDIHSTELLSVIFDIPLNMYSSSEIKGYISDDTGRFRVEGHFPQFSYKNMFVESGLIRFENLNDQLNAYMRLTNYRKNNVLNIAFNTSAANDQLVTRIDWGNDSKETYSGHFEAKTSFSRSDDEDASLKTVVEVQPTSVILNDTVWKIDPSRIIADSEKIHIDNFNFGRENQYLHIDGYLSDNMRHTAVVDLKEISVSYVFDIFNFKSVDFGGKATGYAHINRAFKDPVMYTNLSVKDFTFNNSLLGDLEVYGEWDGAEEGIHLDAKIKEKDLSKTNVRGYIYPIKPKSGLDLKINAENTNVGFLEEYLDVIASDIKGRATGDVRIFGGFKTLNLEGKLKTDASMKINILDTYFALKDSISLSPEEITFNNLLFEDMEGHKGIMNGYLRHKHFKNMNYRLEVNANNMLVMNTKDFLDMPFYGTVYATGNAVLRGRSGEFSVDAALSTNRNTNFVYSLAPAASAVSNQFIKFVDRSMNRNFDDSLVLSDFEKAQFGENKTEQTESDVRLNIQIDATPDATVKIIMDPISGDYISGKGTGNLRTEYYNKGDLKMFGNYSITQGTYKFSLQEVIRKDFTIKEGSNILFNGNPLDAVMGVQAIYGVSSASLYDLLPADAFETYSIRPTVRVNCIMDISGALEDPTIRLNIELPNERDEVQALVKNYISTTEDINIQVLYLLAIGKFYTPDYVNVSQNSNMMSSMLSSTLSGQFNNMLSQILNNNNWNFGTNVSTGDKGWTDVEVEGVLSGQLLNNRLLINGNFGYRENPLATTNFIGDFEAEWLLNRSGDIRLRAYNQTNDKYYIRTNLTTQGLGIMFKKDFDRWSDLFFWRKRKYKLNSIQTQSPQ